MNMETLTPFYKWASLLSNCLEIPKKYRNLSGQYTPIIPLATEGGDKNGEMEVSRARAEDSCTTLISGSIWEIQLAPLISPTEPSSVATPCFHRTFSYL